MTGQPKRTAENAWAELLMAMSADYWFCPGVSDGVQARFRALPRTTPGKN